MIEKFRLSSNRDELPLIETTAPFLLNWETFP